MKLWIDDVRHAPKDFFWVKSVDEAKEAIEFLERQNRPIELLDMDHDAGDYARFGGDYIKLLDWLEATNRNYSIRIHSMNPVGVQNMKNIIRKNGWKEVN